MIVNSGLFTVNPQALLEKVVLNLVKNSIEAMESGGNLSIQSKLWWDKLEITKADDGWGIPEERKEKIKPGKIIYCT